jgi:hypothetical protein
MSECKAGFDQLSIDLVKEAEFNGIGCIAPDGKVGSTLCDGRAQGPGISGKHERYLAVF